MSVVHLTTRKGNITSLIVYHYQFAEWIKNDKLKKDNLKRWLTSVSGFLIYKISDKGFVTYAKIQSGYNSQYQFTHSSKLTPPFENTQSLSKLISKFLRNELLKSYKQILNLNSFIISSTTISPFKLLKTIEFNVEVFASGRYYIHLNPSTKIVNEFDSITVDYLKSFIPGNKIDNVVLQCNIINVSTSKRVKIDLAHIDDFPSLLQLIEEQKCISSFDYKFLSAYSKDIFNKITQLTLKDLNSTIHFINPIIQNIALPQFLSLDDTKYQTVQAYEFGKSKNLRVGAFTEKITLYNTTNTYAGQNIEFTRDSESKEELISAYIKDANALSYLNKISFPFETVATVKLFNDNYYLSNLFNKIPFTLASVQSAVNFNGIYKCPDKKYILPVFFGNYDINNLRKTFISLSPQSKNLNVLSPIHVSQYGELKREEITDKITGIERKTLIAVFVKNKMPHDFVQPLKTIPGIKYQLYNGNFSGATLSNFVCKCLEKLGGIVSLIHDAHVNEDGYFIGLDLGHTTVSDEKFSNLAVALFDCHGILVGSHVIKQVTLAENLSYEICKVAFIELNKILEKKHLPVPKQVVIHRDGKLHKSDKDYIVKVINEIWGAVNLDIVEIIKSGFPVIVTKKDNKNCVVPESGSAFLDKENKYAILITNTQVAEHNTAANPIVIKHKYGTTDFVKIVDQVYWFTKIYTNNLYNSTRLPATTLKANNIAGTSKKVHRQSYLG